MCAAVERGRSDAARARFTRADTTPIEHDADRLERGTLGLGRPGEPLRDAGAEEVIEVEASDRIDVATGGAQLHVDVPAPPRGEDELREHRESCALERRVGRRDRALHFDQHRFVIGRALRLE